MKLLYVQKKEDADDLRSFFIRKAIAVDIESDYDKALYYASVNNYDLILLSYTIGNKICEDLRAHNNKTPIIFFIDEDESNLDKLNALKIGGDDVMRKPINTEELYLRIIAILRRPKEYIGNFLEFEDFCLDLRNKRFYYKDNLILLTKKEVSLVDFFMRNRGMLLTKDDLLENVWDMNANPFSNVVEVYIRSIRKKVQEYTNKEFIHNMQGMGYYIGEIGKIKRNKFYDQY
ncbi:MAG TPA: response regulator transcription factor [bacterium]|nr:response regulator transcription factor [bacterium]